MLLSEQTNKPTVPESYMLLERRFFGDEIILNYLKSEIWGVIESTHQARVDTTLAMVTKAIESNGRNIAEAAESQYYGRKTSGRGAGAN